MGDERIYSIEKSFLSEDLKEGNYRPACNTPVRCHFTGKLIVTKGINLPFIQSACEQLW